MTDYKLPGDVRDKMLADLDKLASLAGGILSRATGPRNALRNLEPWIEQEPAEGLPWRMDYDALKASPKKVLAHFFAPYPRSWNNESPSNAQYLNYFNNPTYSIYSETGGMFRDRPLERGKLGADWLRQDMAWWITQAQAAGIDGFACDLLGISGQNHDRYMALCSAADEAGFTIMPQIDMNGATRKADAKTAAGVVRQYLLTGEKGSAARPSAWRLPDGRFVVGAFKAEGDGDVAAQKAWLGQLFAALRDEWGVEVAWLPTYLNWNRSADFDQWGSGSWGYGADPAAIAAASDQTGQAHSRGEVAFAPVCAQDVRYGNGGPKFDECAGFAAQQTAWEKVIGENPEFVLLVTWNDFSETPIALSVQNGWTLLDLCSWWITQWKTGTPPKILRDAVYLAHRSQTLDAATTQPKPETQFSRSKTTTPADVVDVVAFLTAPAIVTVHTGAATHDMPGRAGMNRWTVQAEVCEPGQIGAEVVRDGAATTSVTSPVGHRTTDVSSDRGYYRFSSLRGTDGQEDTLARYR